MALGALEHVTLMTLSIEPSYCMHQVVYENLPWSRLQQVTEKISMIFPLVSCCSCVNNPSGSLKRLNCLYLALEVID